MGQLDAQKTKCKQVKIGALLQFMCTLMAFLQAFSKLLSKESVDDDVSSN